MVHAYNGILLSHKTNEIRSFVEIWMDLEPVIQNEVKKGKKISYINAYMWNLEKWYK